MPRKRKEDTETEANEEPVVRRITRKRAQTEDTNGVEPKKARTKAVKAVDEGTKPQTKMAKGSRKSEANGSDMEEEQKPTAIAKNGKQESTKKVGRGRAAKAVKETGGSATRKEKAQDSKKPDVVRKTTKAKTAAKDRDPSPDRSSESDSEVAAGRNPRMTKKGQKSNISAVKTEKNRDSKGAVAGKKTAKAKIVVKEQSASSDSSSESEWEDVAEHPYAGVEPAATDDAPGTSKSIQITVNAPKTKKQLDVEGELRRALKRFRKELQENLHKAHLLSFIAYGRHLSSACNNELNQAVALSMVPVGYTGFGKDQTNGKEQLKRFVKWFCSGFTMADEGAADSELVPTDLVLGVRRNLQTRVAFSYMMLTLCFVTTVRALGFDARVVINVHPISRKMESESNTPEGAKKKAGTGSRKTATKTQPKKESLGKSATPGKGNDAKESAKRRRSAVKYLSSDSDSDSDSWSASSTDKKRFRRKRGIASGKNDGKSKGKKDDSKEAVSTGSSVQTTKSTTSKASADDLSVKTEASSEYWAEVYMESSEQWFCKLCNFFFWFACLFQPISSQIFGVNCMDSSVDSVDSIINILTPPVLYCLAFDKDLALKDVTGRYASDFMSSQTRRSRMQGDWLTKTFDLFRSTKRIRNRLEDLQLEAKLSQQSLPTCMSDFKNHPLYVMKRDLKKFEGIYPPNMKPVGYFRTEAIYPRSAVHTLHSKDTWRKEALSVREGEEPYKIVKGRPKWDSLTKSVLENREVSVYGRWQTEPYRAPAAKDGMVPRNEYGNVYLFKKSMLPPGTVHLQLPGLLSIAKKMDVDCAPAMTGWDFHGRMSHPVLDGFVVCEEYKDALVAAWEEEQELAEQRERDRRSNKAVQNWRRLIKAALVREKLRRKFKSHVDNSSKSSQVQGACTSKGEEAYQAGAKVVKAKKPGGESSDAGEKSKETMTTRNRASWPQCHHEFTGNQEEEL